MYLDVTVELSTQITLLKVFRADAEIDFGVWNSVLYLPPVMERDNGVLLGFCTI